MIPMLELLDAITKEFTDVLSGFVGAYSHFGSVRMINDLPLILSPSTSSKYN
jgi:hypothetical protein